MNYSKYIKFLTSTLSQGKKVITDHKKSVFDIEFDSLKKDFDLIIFDFDDTLVDFLGQLSQKTKEFLKSLRENEYKLAVFSNCSKQRAKELKEILDKIGIYNVTRSDKPAPTGFSEAMEHFNISSEKTIAIGDKLGTEMYGAYLANIKKRILVEPFSYTFGGNKANIIHRFVRRIEKILYFRKLKTNPR